MFAAFDEFHEPAQALVEHRGLQTVTDQLAFLVRGNQPCLPQQRQMVRHRRLAQRERGGEFARRVVAFAEQVEQSPPGRIVQRTKEDVHGMIRSFDNYRNNANRKFMQHLQTNLALIRRPPPLLDARPVTFALHHPPLHPSGPGTVLPPGLLPGVYLRQPLGSPGVLDGVEQPLAR